MAPVALNLRGTTIELPRDHVPASVLAHLARTGSSYLDVSGADFDALLDVYRRRGISPRQDAKEVLRLQEAARYLQDSYIQFEIKQVLPLRRATHAAKGTAAYPRHLEALAMKLDEVGRRESEPRDLMLAQRKRVRAAEFVASHPAAQLQLPAVTPPRAEAAAAAGPFVRSPQQQPAAAMMPNHPTELTPQQLRALQADQYRLHHLNQQQRGLGLTPPALVATQLTASSGTAAGQALNLESPPVQQPRAAATMHIRPGAAATNHAESSRDAAPQLGMWDEIFRRGTFVGAPLTFFRPLSVHDVRVIPIEVWETSTEQQINQLTGSAQIEFFCRLEKFGSGPAIQKFFSAAFRSLLDQPQVYFKSFNKYLVVCGMSARFEVVASIPAAVYSHFSSAASVVLPLAHIAVMTPEQAKALVENKQKTLSSRQTEALLARLR